MTAFTLAKQLAASHLTRPLGEENVLDFKGEDAIYWLTVANQDLSGDLQPSGAMMG
jgi:hypothetical protein